MKLFLEILVSNRYVQAILAYAVILIVIGWYAGKRVKSSSGFFVAGRKLGTGLLFTTLIAANIGAGSTVGVAAIAYKSGISAWWWIGSAGIGSMVLAFLVGPKIWRISCRYNLYTLGDYLDLRYSKAFRGLISSMMAIGTLALFSGQLLGIAWILEVVAGLPKTAGVIVGAAVTTLYFAAGGLLSAAIVNIVEVAVIMAGFLISLPYIYSFAGGWNGLVANISANPQMDAAAIGNYFSMGGIGSTVIIGYLFMLIPSFFISPGLIGKVFGARGEREIRIGTAMNGIVQLLFAVIPVVIGMAAFASFPSLSRADLALPTAMKEMMPFGIATLALAAIFAAEVSTADAVLYMLATSVSNDLYRRFLNPGIGDSSLLKLSRIITLISGVLGVLFALYLDSIISALVIFYSLMSVSLAAPLLFGLFTRRASNAGAMAASLCGVLVTLFITFYTSAKTLNILGIAALDTKTKLVDFGFTKLNATTCGIIVAFIVMTFVLFISPSVKPELDSSPISPE